MNREVMGKREGMEGGLEGGRAVVAVAGAGVLGRTRCRRGSCREGC